MAKANVNSFKWNYSEFDKIRKSQGVTNLCRQAAQQAFAKISNIEGYTLEERSYETRNGFVIMAVDNPAIEDNKQHDTLKRLV